ncbi:hypothetical protein [Helicobacter bilis]|uniref:hypothetical protein n=1 Tax=Helicobacter bilis TaxID=37372 RepID=UPI000B198912|nr:hypothetical protein [Helicobacter bilis]
MKYAFVFVMQKLCLPFHLVSLSRSKNIFIFMLERCFAIAQHDRKGGHDKEKQIS